MLLYVDQNIFESPAQVIVNTVNTVGVMGKGIAKDYKKFYPEMFKEYQHFCEIGALDIGKLWLYKTSNKWILNFPTKKHWRNPSKSEYIELGLKKFVSTYKEKNIKSISFPQLGVGNGGLDWEKQVKPLMEKYLADLPIDVFIHLYSKNVKPEFQEPEKMKLWLNSNPINLSFIEVKEDIERILQKERFGTIDINGKKVRVTFFKEKEIEIADTDFISFCYVDTKETKNVYVYEIFDLWNILRDSGFITTRDLNRDKLSKYKEIFSLLNLLPYIKLTYAREPNTRDDEIILSIDPFGMPSYGLERTEEII
ncbi:macro domain-containing protein [Enterococcus sp. DIV0098]|uniref:macro domain-containing protein n=1 Tax=Enterococcus sp. DIV0098 TaxID=2774843 RepID=UPI003F203E19